MEQGAPDKSSSRLANLTLRVELEGVSPQEVFLQHGLSIGRNASNAIAIADPQVERIHARVLRQSDGSLCLACDEENNADIALPDGTRTRRLLLHPGVNFFIGPAQLTCDQRAGSAAADVGDNRWQSSCPRCRSELSTHSTDVDAKCLTCGLEVFYYKQASGETDPNSFRGWLPRKVGPYRVRAFVAQGGMSVVLRGLHEQTDLPAAIKLLRIDSDPVWRERFAAEVGTLKRLEHPNVVTLQDHGADQRLMWLATDWIEGQSLASRIDQANQNHQAIPLPEIQETMRRLRDGLEYLHSLGVIHRDLKPGNVLIARDRTVKIVDVGIAKTIGSAVQATTTQTGTLLGTASYLAPEQLEGNAAGVASDVYCFALIWYEMLTGKPPAMSFRPASERRPETPSGWNGAILKCLSPDPRGRPHLKEIETVLKARITKPFTRKDAFELVRALAALVVVGAIVIGAAGGAMWGLAKANAVARLYAAKLWHYIRKEQPNSKPSPVPMFRIDGLAPLGKPLDTNGHVSDLSRSANLASILRASLDFSAALDRAGRGDVAAMVDVADRYAHGRDGAPLDEKSARKWWAAAGEKGSVAAMLALAGALKRDAENKTLDGSARAAAAADAVSWYQRVIDAERVTPGDFLVAYTNRNQLREEFASLTADQSADAGDATPDRRQRP